MSTVSLGFEPDTTIRKSEIAKIQLVEAIKLFLMGNYLCAVTLAGASEGILAGLVNQQGKSSAVENAVDSIQRIRGQIGLQALDKKGRNEIFNGWNDARNKLKHHGEKDGETVTVNLFDESYWMLRRCISNAEMLGISIPNRDEFENWVVINVNM